MEALHPALASANDLSGFLAGIHVAMISTFLGLLTRLVAMEGSRVNDKLLERADLRLLGAEGRPQGSRTDRMEGTSAV